MSNDHSNVVPSYMRVFYTLCVLTILTVVAAKALEFPREWGMAGDIMHVTIGVVIAIIKVMCVMYIFMHLKFDNPLIRIAVFVPAFLFTVIVFALNFLETWNYTY